MVDPLALIADPHLDRTLRLPRAHKNGPMRPTFTHSLEGSQPYLVWLNDSHDAKYKLEGNLVQPFNPPGSAGYGAALHSYHRAPFTPGFSTVEGR